jgi:acetyl-CoA C-acetyltransferase
MVCGSGMKAIMNVYADIIAGEAKLVLVGDTKIMSNAGFVMGGEIRKGHKMLICKQLTI